jgi:hypothetical protein
VTAGDLAAARPPALSPHVRPPRDVLPASHPPELPAAPAIEDTYRELVGSLSAELRPLAERLPWRLGLTASPDGGWSDFVGLHPNRALPVYAAQSPDGTLGMAQEDLSRYLRAHHIGGFTWLLRDRLEDGQVIDPEDGLFELAEVFDRRWRDALGAATGDVRLADLMCRRAAARWRRGTGAENRLLAGCALRAPIYAAIVREKLSWIGVPSQALLLSHGNPDRAPLFLHAHDLFLLGLQAVDDVVDANQDRALRGGDVPTALRCSPGALVRVAPKLVQRAAVAAAEGGFTWFANWLEAFADAIVTWRLDGDRVGDELDAIGIAGEIEEAVLRAAEMPVRIAAPACAAAAPG